MAKEKIKHRGLRGREKKGVGIISPAAAVNGGRGD